MQQIELEEVNTVDDLVENSHRELQRKLYKKLKKTEANKICTEITEGILFKWVNNDV